MYVFISILILIASILLILIVLIQNSKGGGLASGFSSSNQIMGVRKTTDFLEKATWSLAGTVIVLSILITAFIPRAEHAAQSEIKQRRYLYRSEYDRSGLWYGSTTGSSGRGNSRYYYTCGGKQQIRILFENNIEVMSTNNGCDFFLCYFKCKLL